MLLAQAGRGHRAAAPPDLLWCVLAALFAMGLVMLQPDLGTTMVLSVSRRGY